MDAITEMVFMIAALMLLGALGEFIFSRTGIPDMIWLVAAGIVAGPVFNVVDPELFKPIVPFFGAVALVSILAGGGIKLRISEVVEAVGIGLIVGVAGAAALLPLSAPLLGKSHAYTVFLAGFLMVYGMAQFLGGNGSLAILTTALIIGNAETILPLISANRFNERLFVRNDAALKIHDHMSFFIKSFFFFLIGLMFPTSPRMILIGLTFALVMLLFRIPAVAIALIGANFRFHQQSMIAAAIPRGMAAGVLSTLPMYYGVPGMENLSQGVFSAIVFSILIFTLGFSLLRRMEKSRPITKR